jgi:hypothetical protein
MRHKGYEYNCDYETMLIVKKNIDAKKNCTPAGIEPTLRASEARVLSIELQGQNVLLICCKDMKFFITVPQ